MSKLSTLHYKIDKQNIWEKCFKFEGFFSDEGIQMVYLKVLLLAMC